MGHPEARILLLVGLAFTGTACPEDTCSDPDLCELADPEAQQKCEDLVDTLCLAVSENCIPFTSYEYCLDEFEEIMNCDRTLGIGDSYDECMDLLETEDSCWLNALPDECDGVLIYLG